MKLVSALGSLFVTGLFVVGSLGAGATQTGCSGTCSDSESASCSEKFTSCVQTAVASASKAQCLACAKSYCECFDDCGSDCDPSEHEPACGAL